MTGKKNFSLKESCHLRLASSDAGLLQTAQAQLMATGQQAAWRRFNRRL